MDGEGMTRQNARRAFARASARLRDAGIKSLNFGGPNAWTETIQVGVQPFLDLFEDIHPVLRFEGGNAIRHATATVRASVLPDDMREVVADILSHLHLGERVSLEIRHADYCGPQATIWPPSLEAGLLRAFLAPHLETLAELDELAKLDEGVSVHG